MHVPCSSSVGTMPDGPHWPGCGKLLSSLVVVVLFLSPFASAQAALRHIDFNKNIEPILADNCYQCHGPDPGGRKAGLRLDHPETAFAKLKDGRHPIVAGS